MLTMIDVSMYQGAINWARVKQDGIGLAYVKCTQGAHELDPRFHANRAETDALGIRCGFYAYVEPGGASPAAQAAYFAHAVGRLGRRELRPAQDLESGNAAHTEEFARAFSRAVTHELGCTPIFYSYSAYIAAMKLRTPIGGGLWLASYGRNDGTDHGADVPRPWRKWVAHQFTSTAHASGIAGRVDVSHAPKLTPLLAHPVLGRL
jgi:lysozyme